MYVNNTRIFVKLKYFCFYILNAKTGYKRSHNILKMNSAIETELRNLLDNVNKTLALKMSEKHGLDYEEVYEFLTASMNEDKAPASRGRPKKEKKTITENHKDTTGKPDVNHIIKEIMEKDAELEELTEDEIEEDVVVVAAAAAKEASPAPKSDNKDKDNNKDNDNDSEHKEDDKKPKEKAKRKPAAVVSDEEKAKAAEEKKAKAAEEKAKAAEEKKAKAAAEKAKAAEEKKAAAEKAKADKAAAKAAEKEAAKAEKKPKGKASASKKEEKVEVAAAEEEAEAAEEEEEEEEEEAAEGLNVYEFEFDEKTYLKQEFGTSIFDAETHKKIGDWDEKNNKIIFNA